MNGGNERRSGVGARDDGSRASLSLGDDVAGDGADGGGVGGSGALMSSTTMGVSSGIPASTPDGHNTANTSGKTSWNGNSSSDIPHEVSSTPTPTPMPAVEPQTSTPTPAPASTPTLAGSTSAPTPAHVSTQTIPPVPQTPQTHLTFLLVSGRRRTMSFEPSTMVGRVKELVWNAWPSEWQDERPPAPSYLRILYLGKILQDDDTLTQLNLPTHTPGASSTTPLSTIVHLSIRVYAPPTEDAPKKRGRRRTGSASPGSVAGVGGGGEGVGREGEGVGRRGCCGCVIC